MVICLERGADLHMLMPLPLTVSCFSKIQIGFAFLVPAHPGRPGKRVVKRVCVCVCVCVCLVCYYSGYGVFATQDFCKGDFMLDYCGEIIRPEDGDLLPDQTYVYHFSINNNSYW